MSKIDEDLFLEWAKDRFGDVLIRKNEVLTHSIFCDDNKYHLYMNPRGGKKELPYGAYRCWKTDKRGSLVSLVMEVDKISFDEAEERICSTTSLAFLEKRLHDFFEEKKVEEVPKNLLNLPENTFLIEEMKTQYQGQRAIAYLNDRKIPITGLFICIAGKYKDRIIIPYYDLYEELIWFNARTIYNVQPKYLKPETGSQENVLYFKKYPKPGKKVYLTEGEIDALSLEQNGLIGCACGGKFLSESQIELLRDYEVCLSFDNDKTGLDAIINVGNQLLAKGFDHLTYIRPPKGYKDWNELLVKVDNFKEYIVKNEKVFSSFTSDSLRFHSL